jgi:hypothetical protein
VLKDGADAKRTVDWWAGIGVEAVPLMALQSARRQTFKILFRQVAIAFAHDRL